MIPDFAEIMDLCMAVVARGYAIIRARGQYLVRLYRTVLTPCLWVTRLEEAPAPAAAEVVGAVGGHVDEVFFPHHRLDDESEVFGHGVAKGLANELAGILHGELYLSVFVPVGADLELTFPDPLRVVLDDAFYFKVVRDVEFLHSGPECKEFVPSFGVEPDLAA